VTADLLYQGKFYENMSQVVNGKSGIEARLAWKLAAVLGTTPEFWLNLQNSVDLWDAYQSLADWQPATTYPASVEMRSQTDLTNSSPRDPCLFKRLRQRLV
jgi:plasmid maintenance system antidote protein VapI